MKKIYGLLILVLTCLMAANAQDVVPKAKTKADRKAERKNMTLEQKIEDTLPVDVSLPSAKGSVTLPGNNKISSVDDARKFFNKTIPDFGSDIKKKSKKAKKALEKAKAEIFDGKSFEKIAIEKKIWKRGSGNRLDYKEFYILKDYQRPNPYLRTYTWYDRKANKIVEAISRDTKTNTLLHGPYKEYKGENLIAEGYYFLGVKHGRWVTYDKDFNLLDKIQYNKGFTADSEIVYYSDSTKIKEVIPKLYGKTSGYYFRFYEDATLAEEGKYDDSKKIGKWVEYFPGNKRKKETQYPADCYDPKEPVVLLEYDQNGKITYEAAPKK
jgi:antitoxin component YwqK of YwqJK toxin-antitoxin module